METERGLGVENPSLPEEKPKSKPAKTIGSAKNQSSGNSNPLGAVLPSMNKSVAKKSKPQNIETTTKPEKGGNGIFGGQEDSIKTMDLSLPSYAEGIKTKEKGLFSI